jgi:hypothetical protein
LFPSSNANYLHGWAGDWHEWLQERSEDGTTPGTDLTLRGLDALTATGDGGVLTLIGGDGGGTSGDGGDIVLVPGDQTSGEYGQILCGNASAITSFALLEINGTARSATNATDVLLVATGDTNSYAEIGFASYDPTEYASWYLGAWGYQRSTNPGKFYLLHYRNVAGSLIDTLPFVVTDDDKIGFSTDDPDTLLHLHEGSAGSVTAPSNIAGGIIYNDGATPDGFQFRVNGNQTKAQLTSAGNWIVVGQVEAIPTASDTSGVKGTGIGAGYGVHGIAGNNASSAGVYGAGHASINTPGVRALGGGTNGHGVYGEAKGSGNGVYGFGAVSGTGNGVFGTSQNATGAGVRGLGFGVGTGVYGVAGNTAGAVGVGGVGGTGGGIGVQGTGTTSYSGVKGTGGPTNGLGVEGIGIGTNSGVKGTGGSTSGIGVEGVGGSTNGEGVKGTGTGTGAGVYGLHGSSGPGVVGESTSGYGVIADGNSTRAPLRLIPLSSAPSSGSEGDLYMNSTDHKLYVHNGTTFVVVGSQVA